MRHRIEVAFPSRLHDEAYAFAEFLVQHIDRPAGTLLWAELAARMHAIETLAAREVEPDVMVMCLIRKLVLDAVHGPDRDRVDAWLADNLQVAATHRSGLQSQN